MLSEIIKIILKHADPERIYLFGSQLTKEANQSSDIDIAYDDKNFRNHELIAEEISKLNTLRKIDVKNIAFAGERFRNRVISTGKVLYSKSKKLRFEDALYNFSKALETFSRIVRNADHYKDEGIEDMYNDAVIKRFEYTYEMSWKVIKRYLDYTGITVKSPRESFREAYAQGIIESEDIWLEMIENRNLTSHIYDEFEIMPIIRKMGEYEAEYRKLLEYLKR